MTAPMDPSKDPDRFDSSSTSGKTLPQLLGDGAQEDDRNNLTWLLGLLAVLSFLVLVSLLAHLGGGH